jgi:Na+/proline symporter
MVFVFYLFTKPPIFFNTPALARVAESEHAAELTAIEERYDRAFVAQRAAAEAYLQSDRDPRAKEALKAAATETRAIRAEAKELVKRAVPKAETKDADYVFIGFVLHHLPAGLIGLLIAVIFCASMSSTASELAALGSTSTIDLYKRILKRESTPRHDLIASKLFTVLWGLVAVSFASFASLLDNLIQAVNILGSVFYGTLLGLFLTAFFAKRVTATPVLIAALIAQATVVGLFLGTDLGFLWYNVVGCGIVVSVSFLLQLLRRD